MNKTAKILELSNKSNLAVADIAKKVGCSPNYVYHVRWTAKNKNGKKKHVKRGRVNRVGKMAPALSPRLARKIQKAIRLLEAVA